jgi:hypothetical protein
MNRFIAHLQVVTINNYNTLKITLTISHKLMSSKTCLVTNLIWLTLQLLNAPWTMFVCWKHSNSILLQYKSDLLLYESLTPVWISDWSLSLSLLGLSLAQIHECTAFLQLLGGWDGNHLLEEVCFWYSLEFTITNLSLWNVLIEAYWNTHY